ncbi:MAG: hypothetical protein GXX84_10040 [Acidobacteria bacterium]|nr:hypothetical protein [Acidobacteriota bacterium]
MRKILIRIAVIAVLLIALVTAAALILQSPPVKGLILGQAREYARRNLGSDLSIDAFDYSLARGTVSFETLVFRPRPGVGGEPSVSIGRGTVAFDPASLLTGSPSIRSVRVEEVVINVLIDRDGGSNLPQLRGNGAGPGFAIEIVEIDRGSVRIEDQRQQIVLMLPSWDLRKRESAISLHTLQGGVLAWQGREFDIKELSLQSRLVEDSLKIVNLDVMAEGSRAVGSGIIRDLSNPVFDLTFDTHVDLGQAAALGGLTDVQGRADGILRVTGTPGDLHIKGKFDVDEIGAP